MNLNAGNPKVVNVIKPKTGTARLGKVKVAVVEARSGIDRTIVANHAKDRDVVATTMMKIKEAPQVVPAVKSIHKGMTVPNEAVRTTSVVNHVAVTREVAVPTMITNVQERLGEATRSEAATKSDATKAKDGLMKEMSVTKVLGGVTTNIIKVVRHRAVDPVVRVNRENLLARPEVGVPDGKALAVDNNRHR
jgi:hypothetical protein